VSPSIELQVHLKSSGICVTLVVVTSKRPSPTGALTIGEVAARSGVATSALRFYEDQGLIASERTSAGHRRYSRSVLRLVAFVVFAQRVGLTLEEIKAELAKLPRNRVPHQTDWAALTTSWKRRVRERIAELERLEAGLTECIGCGCLSLDRCQLANPGDRLSRRGPGPRMWVSDRGSAARDSLAASGDRRQTEEQE